MKLYGIEWYRVKKDWEVSLETKLTEIANKCPDKNTIGLMWYLDFHNNRYTWN